ncbi:biotin operon repressor [Butyrivibrio sp. VCB2006]|uniref:biotin operon repressor n=1 Tax=Butyrivibrio sp. VCB2006 TaxID=1280679 RepID=UPI0004213D72|nr:HTH domain-containing protein [Butyrivibrio sp. VCB2006]
MGTRESLLELLEQNKGDFVSSRVITDSLKVTRNAVWKAVNELKEAGYEIDSIPNKGYMLSKDSDIISLQGIAAYLSDKSKIQNVTVFDELGSTNMSALLSLIPGISEQTVIVAKRQTRGVGHGKTDYASPEGGVYISIICSARDENGEYLTASDIGSRVSGQIEKEIGKKVTLDEKTNGIFVGKKKVCGILTEYIADLETGQRSSYIIGIGIQPGSYIKNRLIAHLIEEFC